MSAGGPGADATVDEIVFHWVPREASPLGVPGFGPAVSSVRDLDRLQRLAGLLRGVSSSGVAADPPRGSLVYVPLADGTGDAAVIRRVPARDFSDRPSSLAHAMIGPATILDARMALRLSRWPHWFGTGWSGGRDRAANQVNPDAFTAPLPARHLWTFAANQDADPEASLARRAQAPAAGLERLLAHVLASADGRSLTVIRYPDPPEPLLFGLMEVLEPILSGAGATDWSFSTFETAEARIQPRFTFVDRLGMSDFKLDHLRVRDLVDPAPAPATTTTGVSPPPLIAYTAGELALTYEGGGPEAVRALLASYRPPRPGTPVAAWAADFGRWRQSTKSRPLALLERALTGNLSGEEQAELWRPDTIATLTADLEDLDLPRVWRLAMPGSVGLVPPAARPALGRRLIAAVLDLAGTDPRAVRTAVRASEAATDSRHAAAFILIDHLITDDEDVHTAVLAWRASAPDLSPESSLAAACAIARFRPLSAGEKPPGENDKLMGTILAPVPLADILTAIGDIDDDAARMLVIGLGFRPKNGTSRDERDDRAEGRRWLAERAFGPGHRPPSTAERQALIAHFFRTDLTDLSDLRDLFSGFTPEHPHMEEVREFFAQLNSNLRRTRKAGHLHADLDIIALDLGFEQLPAPARPRRVGPREPRSPDDGRNARRPGSGRSTRPGTRKAHPPAETGLGWRAKTSRLVPWRRGRADAGHATAPRAGAPATSAPNAGRPAPGTSNPSPPSQSPLNLSPPSQSPPNQRPGTPKKPRRDPPQPSRHVSSSMWPFVLIGVVVLVVLGMALWRSLH